MERKQWSCGPRITITQDVTQWVTLEHSSPIGSDDDVGLMIEIDEAREIVDALMRAIHRHDARQIEE